MPDVKRYRIIGGSIVQKMTRKGWYQMLVFVTKSFGESEIKSEAGILQTSRPCICPSIR